MKVVIDIPKVSEKVKAERRAEMDIIAEFLSDGKVATATEIAKATDLSIQKVSARLKSLVADGKVAKTEAKGKNPAAFTVAE